jgi:hypothetical protein
LSIAQCHSIPHKISLHIPLLLLIPVPAICNMKHDPL